MPVSDAVGEIIQDTIDGIEAAKPLLRLIPPPAGPTIMMGVEYSEALATFIAPERQRAITDQIIALFRAGVGEGIEAAFKQAYPNG